jgi:PilZ domain
MDAKLVDVSQFGARLQSAAPVVIGEELDLKLIPPDGRKVRPVRATVRWCRPISGDLFAIGVNLHRDLSPTELMALW